MGGGYERGSEKVGEKNVAEGRKKIEKLTWCSAIVRRWKAVDGRGEERRVAGP